jgi:hypothetical protein
LVTRIEDRTRDLRLESRSGGVVVDMADITVCHDMSHIVTYVTFAGAGLLRPI